MDKELYAVASNHPEYDYSDPIMVRKRFNLSILIAERANLWKRNINGVTWKDEFLSERNIPVRIYKKSEANALGNAVIYIHGGGFMIGDLDAEHPRCLEMCFEASVTIISIDYRLAPEHKFPNGFDDCFEVIDWIFNHATELQIDPAKIAIVGCSAGGCLATGVVLKRRDLGLILPIFQMLIYPVLDDRMDTESMRQFEKMPVWNTISNKHMWNHYLDKSLGCDELAYSVPARITNLCGMPSTYIVAAELDPLRDEAIEYGRRLLGSGVQTEVHVFPGVFHGFDTLSSSKVSLRARYEQYLALRLAMS